MFAILSVARGRQRRMPRQSPLTRDLLRGPGHSLRNRIEEVDGDVVGYLVILIVIPFLAYSIHISQSYFAGNTESPIRVVASASIALLTTVGTGLLLLRALEERRRLRSGLEGELAVGEELNQLMLLGCRVFHDVPFPYGNIDHVVVCPAGVCSINTKMRGKPKLGENRADAFVDGSRGKIRFPEGEFPIPIAQLETESRWLGQFLSEAVGESVVVRPMLALPGWFIKRSAEPGGAYVFNPRNPHQLFLSGREVLSAEMIRRIAHQLDQRCRDVEVRPRASAAWSRKN
ncbi:MAG: nuclease-related domain-containing protein [Pirellulaceae bacterium]